MTLARVIGGIALLVLFGTPEEIEVLQRLFLLLAVVGLLTGEIIHRIQFYKGYHRIGL